MNSLSIIYIAIVAVAFLFGLDRDYHREWIARVVTLSLVASTLLLASPVKEHHALALVLYALALTACLAHAVLVLVRSVRAGTTYVRFSSGTRKRA